METKWKRASIRDHSPIAVIVVLATLFLVGCPPEPKEHFMAGFVRDGMNDIAVTWSPNGGSWQNGRFPATATSTSRPASIVVPYNGVGASADPAGRIHNILFDQPSAMTDVFGLGPATWDGTGSRQPLTVNPASAPSTVDFGSGKRLIAVRETGDHVGVYLYDSNAHTATAIPITGPLNNNVWSRPALTLRDDGTLLLAWTQNNSMVTAVGRKDNTGAIVFASPRQLTLSSNNISGAASSEPAVGSDDSYFYLAVVQEERGAPLHGWLVVIYQASDGVTWSEFDRVLTGRVTNQTHLGLAAKSTGSLLIAAIASPGGPPRSAVALCSRTSPTARCGWSGVRADRVFIAGAAYKEFALVRTGNE